MKIIVFELDGMHPYLLKKYADEGELSALSSILKSSSYGILESTIPPISGPAWTSFATGVNPGKHGIYNFFKFDRSTGKLHPVTPHDVKYPKIHEWITYFGKSSVVINLMPTYLR